MKRIFAVVVISLLARDLFSAGKFELFPGQVPFSGASAEEFRNYINVGREGGRWVNRGNLGAEFAIVNYQSAAFRIFSAGAAAAVHLVMFPHDMKFAVDNFYATLAAYADAQLSPAFRLRLYPVFHVSGHLGDGSPDDSMLMDARAVSSEMFRVEGEYCPVEWATMAAGYGYYYHVCAQQGLTDRFDASVRCQPVWERWYRPFVTVSGQIIHLSRWQPGVDAEAGIEFVNARGSGLSIGLRYFSRLHPGYFFERREKVVGVQIGFLQ